MYKQTGRHGVIVIPLRTTDQQPKREINRTTAPATPQGSLFFNDAAFIPQGSLYSTRLGRSGRLRPLVLTFHAFPLLNEAGRHSIFFFLFFLDAQRAYCEALVQLRQGNDPLRPSNLHRCTRGQGDPT